MNTGLGRSKYCIPQPFSHCLISLSRSLFDFNSIKEIFSVKSERVNVKKKCRFKKKFDEPGRVKGGGTQGETGGTELNNVCACAETREVWGLK